MGEEVGEIDYDADAELKLGATYPEGEDVAAELLCIQQTEEEVMTVKKVQKSKSTA